MQENQTIFSGLVVGQLKVLNNEKISVEEDSLVVGLGNSTKEALVVVPDDRFEAGDIKKWTNKWEVSKLPQLSYHPSSTLFQLEPNYLAKTGLPTQKLVLYCRPTFHEQFKFLRERVINNGVLGWILSPPGTGTSITSLAFASTLDRNNWIITWIHLDRISNPICVRLEGDLKKSWVIADCVSNGILDILDEVDESKQHIVFLDGYNLKVHNRFKTVLDCQSWLKRDREKKYWLWFVQFHYAKPEEDMIFNVEAFNVYSWKELFEMIYFSTMSRVLWMLIY